MKSLFYFLVKKNFMCRETNTLRVKKFIISLVFILLLQSLNITAFAEDKKLNISPIVQVISYFDIYGKHPKMMWWWSASIINDKWVIISNDHVVDDWKWALSSAFSVCITKDINQKPSCDYTASLIARDDKLDISMLKIDPVDIYWNKVDYTKFKNIDIDFDYIPRTQDETIAIGYPWIWADTISETKWIVSWLSDYNGYKYIKTDTLIAWWNSGWAFVKNWKLIWIPTFWIGFWDSMWYALSIKEAKNFIDQNIWKSSNKNKITEIIDFNWYRKNIENINSKFSIQDDIFNIKFPNDYEVLNYEKNKTVEIGLNKQKDTWINFLSFYIEKSPKLDSWRKLFYYLESIWFYQKDYQKLLKKNIWWIEFYYPIEKNDLSNWDSSWWNSYKAIIDWYIITVDLQAPLYDEKKNKEVKKEIENILSGVKINKNNLPKSINEFSTNIPKIEIISETWTIADTWKYKYYLSNNLYEYVDINLNELIEYNGKWKTVDEIFNVQLKDVDNTEKAKIEFKWLEWYISCSEKISPYFYYNYYGYYDEKLNVDEFWNNIDLKSCQINIYFPFDKELNRQNYISIEINSTQSKIQDNLDKVIKFIEKNIILEWNDKEVKIPNLFSQQKKLNFVDITKQSTQYKNFLKLLIRYWAIENSKYFEGSKPIKWWEYLDLYTKWIYNFDLPMVKCNAKDSSCKYSKYKFYTLEINWEKISLDSIFKDLWINYDYYVDNSTIYDFEKLFLYKLSWVNIWELNDENIALFESMPEEKQYINEKNKINSFNNNIYWTKKILISDFYSNYSTNFNTNKENRFYVVENKLKQVDIFSKKKKSLSIKENDNFNLQIELAKLDKNSRCSSKSTYSQFIKCYNDLINNIKIVQQKYERASENMNSNQNYYIVLSKAEALNQIFTQVDFWLFDSELAKKKDTQIEEPSN